MYWCLLSNLSMMMPFAVAYANGLKSCAMAIMVCALLSSYYHCDEMRHMALFVDIFGVIVLTTMMMIMMRRSHNLCTPMNLLGLVYFVIGLWYYSRVHSWMQDEVYDMNHSLWHVFVSFAITALLYSYIHSTVKDSPASLASESVWTLCSRNPPTAETAAQLVDWAAGVGGELLRDAVRWTGGARSLVLVHHPLVTEGSVIPCSSPIGSHQPVVAGDNPVVVVVA